MTTNPVQLDEESEVDTRVTLLLADHRPAELSPAEFFGAQFDAGLAWVHFPKGCGGLGLNRRLQALVQNRIKAEGGPSPYRNFIGYGMAAPTLLEHGTDSQLDRLLRPLFTGEEVWCQLFSEPGAGSDVAALATRAVRDGGQWTVSGQKVWTTLAHVSRWGMLLARTDPEQPKHKGLTFFVIDLDRPGVEVRPLRQLTGEAEFNEVYLDGAIIPDSFRVGQVGDGWKVALTTLMSERVTLGGDGTPRRRSIDDVLELLLSPSPTSSVSAVARDRAVTTWIDSQVLDLVARRAAAGRAAGSPGPEGAVGKLGKAEQEQRIRSLHLDLLGSEAMMYDTYAMTRPTHAMAFGSPQQAFLRSLATTIEGGTSATMRNILGERVLGLPSEPRLDRGPWNQVPRS
ncbi:MAG: acyl-CoA dehydrogenase [Actinomycetia bacterium]|nr:acyl-CoA dehydrogenase [Actinomycetes bacterium]